MRTLASLFSVLLLAVGATALAQEDATGEVVEVRMITEGSEFYFDPVGLLVEPGTTVRFVNASGMHATTSYSQENAKPQRIPEAAQGWNSPIFQAEGDAYDVVLTEEGVYDYFCPPHEALGMVGRIVVGDPEAYAAQDPAQLQFPAAAEALPDVDAIVNAEGGVLSYEDAPAQ